MHLKSQVLSGLNPQPFPRESVWPRAAPPRIHPARPLPPVEATDIPLLLLIIIIILFFFHSPRDLDIAIDFSLMSGWSGLVVCGGESVFKSDQIEALDEN